jgi:glycosyltransferase involved in cell wall biosynthesis
MAQKFIIFSAGWNCKDFIKRHMKSIEIQSYTNFRHIVINDASTDDTQLELNKYVNNSKTLIFSNVNNWKWVSNAVTYLTPQIQNEEEVIVLVDLDDWLAHPYVLEKLNQIYTNEKVWLTFGQYKPSIPYYSGHRGEWQDKVIKERTFRKAQFTFSALRTFKAFLWLNIKDQDLRDQNGNYPMYSYDQAIMYPMLEMCPYNKIRFINEILYIYNLNTPNNDEKLHRYEQILLQNWFCNKKPYSILQR